MPLITPDLLIMPKIKLGHGLQSLIETFRDTATGAALTGDVTNSPFPRMADTLWMMFFTSLQCKEGTVARAALVAKAARGARCTEVVLDRPFVYRIGSHA